MIKPESYNGEYSWWKNTMPLILHMGQKQQPKIPAT